MKLGLMCELLWSDPLPDPLLGRQPSKRGVGIGFGRDVTENFLRTNGLGYFYLLVIITNLFLFNYFY